jgi:hypothetical protein
VRRLIGALVAMAVIVAALTYGDMVARHRVQTLLADHIETDLPGSTATVHITSFPFTGRLLVSGSIPQLSIDVRDARVDGLTFSSADLVVHDLKIDASQLFHRRVIVSGLRSATVSAVLPEASIDHLAGVDVTIGTGSVGVSGAQVPATASVVANRVTLHVAGLAPISFAVPSLSFLPCVSTAVLQAGSIRVACTLSTVPPILDHFSATF